MFKLFRVVPEIGRDVVGVGEKRDGMRGHKYRYFKERATSRALRGFLPNRIFTSWEALPNDFSDVRDLTAVKRLLDAHYMDSRFQFGHLLSPLAACRESQAAHSALLSQVSPERGVP